MRLSARAPRRTRKCRATKVRNLEQEMRQNNVVFVFARGEKFRQNILIPDFHSRLLGLCVEFSGYYCYYMYYNCCYTVLQACSRLNMSNEAK